MALVLQIVLRSIGRLCRRSRLDYTLGLISSLIWAKFGTEERAKVMAVYKAMLERIRAPGAALGQLPAEERVRIERVAEQAADLFQRSSSCVEGRNGQRSEEHTSELQSLTNLV